MKVIYSPISLSCGFCQQKECGLNCTKVRVELNKSWDNTYKRKPIYKVINNVLTRVN